MMRLQRVGRKNDPSYRIVVTDKRTGVKSDKHTDRIGSYNPKTKAFIIDADKARDWLSKGVQASDTVHNLLITQKVIEGKKVNALPKKSPIIDEEAIKKAEAEALAKVEAEKAKAEAEKAKAEEPVVEIVADESAPTDHAETAKENPEDVAKVESDQAATQADSEGD